MKFIIFADKNYNYRKPMADGLCKHLRLLGHEVIILYDGNYWLSEVSLLKTFLGDVYKLVQNIRYHKQKYFLRFWNMLFFKKRYYKDITNADCLIIVDNCPNVYYRNQISRVEDLRMVYNGPIVNYDLHYLPNQGWYSMIIEQDSQNFGLDRFDWYLPASLVTEYAIPRNIPQIYNCIGFDLQSIDLYPEQTDFLAVLDFEHKGYEKERKIQIEALEQAGIKYICLKGRYTRSEIREIYRKCSIFFTSVRESFSMPVIEVQLCGGLIATPYEKWLPAHFINKDLYVNGDGALGRNFLVYNNDKYRLINQLNFIKQNFNPKENIVRFKEDYPFYYTINDSALLDFCSRINDKRITKDSHKIFKKYNEYINLQDRVLLNED